MLEVHCVGKRLVRGPMDEAIQLTVLRKPECGIPVIVVLGCWVDQGFWVALC